MSYRHIDGDAPPMGSTLGHLARTSGLPPHPSGPTPTPPTEGTLSHKLTERIVKVFGSVEQFRDRVVLGTRFVMVDCAGYPYTVFCRQCQVYPYNQATLSLGAPFRTAVVLHNIALKQGVQAWWRGWYSHLSLLVARPFANALLEKIAPPPRSLSEAKRLKPFLGYLALKALTCVSMMPLLSFSLLEMVQDTTQKVYTRGILEVITDRPLLTVDPSHRLPFLSLAMPTIFHGFMSDLTSLLTQKLFDKILPNRTANDALSAAMRGLWTSYLGSFLADIILYPLQTVIVRLYCQGMPVLVDNIETGLDIAFITTYYRGYMDCVGSIWDTEGVWGFYKGFSALLLRYLVHGLVLLLMWRLLNHFNSRWNGHALAR